MLRIGVLVLLGICQMKSGFVSSSVSYGTTGSEIVGYLGGGSARNEGWLQLYIDGTWTTVCNRNWTYEAADFTCKMLGFDGVQPDGWNAADFGEGTGPVWCYSPEQGELMPCPTDGDVCTHSDDAGLRCTWTPEPGDFMNRLGYMFRLAGGNAEQGEGRVEVYLNDEWATICHYGWSQYFADAVCRHLGYQGVRESNWNVPFGEGTGPVVCAEIFSLSVCSSDVCTHAQDVGVRCETDEGMAGGSEEEGRDMEVVRIGIIAAASVLVAGGVFIPIVACFLAHSQPASGRIEDCEKMLSSSDGSFLPEQETLDDVETETEGKVNGGFVEGDTGECSGGTQVKVQMKSDEVEEEGDGGVDRKDINEDAVGVGYIDEGSENGCKETNGGNDDQGTCEAGSNAGVCETVLDEEKQNGDRTATPSVRSQGAQEKQDVEGGRDTVEMYEFSMHGEHSLNSVYF